MHGISLRDFLCCVHLRSNIDCSRIPVNKTANSKLLMTKFRPNPSPRFIDRRNRCVTLPWQQNFRISTNPGPANMTCMTFLCMTLIRNETGAHTFLPSFDNANCLLFKKDGWGWNFTTMVTWRQTSPLYCVRLLVWNAGKVLVVCYRSPAVM